MDTCTCYKCGIAFGMPGHYADQRRKDHASFYCPNGHSQAYLGASEEEKLRRERDLLKQQMARKDDEIAAERFLRETVERKVKRLEKRAAGGTCPCCNRTFIALQRHMKTKHPEFSADVVPMREAK